MRVLWITAVVVLLDQASKVAVLRTMFRGESIPLLGDWLKFTFTENPGMAFGLAFGPPGMVTVFAIAATLLIVYYMVHVRNGYTPYRISLAMILGGAIGNIIDRVFYGLLLGYGDLFQGQVVDFIHVNIWRGYISEAIPFAGGTYIALFPIWNVADMAIVLGVVGILFFQRTFHERYEQRVETDQEEAEPSEEVLESVEAVSENSTMSSVHNAPSMSAPLDDPDPSADDAARPT